MIAIERTAGIPFSTMKPTVNEKENRRAQEMARREDLNDGPSSLDGAMLASRADGLAYICERNDGGKKPASGHTELSREAGALETFRSTAAGGYR